MAMARLRAMAMADLPTPHPQNESRNGLRKWTRSLQYHPPMKSRIVRVVSTVLFVKFAWVNPQAGLGVSLFQSPNSLRLLPFHSPDRHLDRSLQTLSPSIL
jgi:hypothetical protein